MAIAGVKIENFRCFKFVEVDFESTHALVGENGCGKTAILEAISLATGSGQPYLHEQDFNNADQGDLKIEVFFNEIFLIRIPDGYTTQDIPCQSILLSAHRREKAAAGKTLSEPFVIERYAVPVVYEEDNVPSINIGDIETHIPTEVKKTLNGFESPRLTGSKFRFTTTRLTLQNDTLNLPDIFYFSRERENQARVGFNSILTKIAKDLNWRFRKNWDQGEIESKWNDFYNLVISTVEDPKTSRIISPLRKKIENVTGNSFSNLELGLLEIEQPFSKTFFSQRIGTNQVEHSRLGSGISILLAYFLLEIISKLSKNEVVFLIDEPELHLHPQLQFSLLKEFCASEFQTIFTTQSDCMINIGEWESITRFKDTFECVPEEGVLDVQMGGKRIRDHLDEIKKWHQHESIFFREDNQIFFAKKCLLVEGPAEKYGLPLLAEKLNIDINGVTIVSCNGKTKIYYYQLLCKAFGIPFFTLFDLDGRNADDGDNKLPKDCAEPSALKYFESSFEEVFGISSERSHKTSDLLILIDTMANEDIPSEVKAIIESINSWLN